MSHQTKRPFDSVECSTPHDLLIRCSLSNLQFPAIALTWCGLTSHRHRSIEPFFMSLAARDSEFRRWSGRVDRRICQTFAASPAEPGELPLGFRTPGLVGHHPTAASRRYPRRYLQPHWHYAHSVNFNHLAFELCHRPIHRRLAPLLAPGAACAVPPSG